MYGNGFTKLKTIYNMKMEYFNFQFITKKLVKNYNIKLIFIFEFYVDRFYIKKM